MAATFSPTAAGDTAKVLIDSFMDSSIDRLCAAVAEEVGMPVGRVRRVVLALQRQRQRSMAGIAAASAAAPGLEAAAPDDPLRWYPLGANGRLRPPGPDQP